MRNFRGICLTIFLVLTVLMISSQASETRTFSMGQTGVFMDDNSNIVFFPGTIMNYGNEIVTELRLKDTERLFSAEVRLPLNSHMFGLNLNRPVSVYNPGVGNFIALNQTSDLYFGTKLGANNLGVRLSYGRDGYNQDSTLIQPQIEESARYLEIAGGFSTDMFDAAISFELPSISSEQNGNNDEYSGTAINMNGRYFYQFNSEVQIIPVVRIGFGSASRTTDIGVGIPQAETDYSSLNFGLGIGANYQFTENSLIIVAIDPYSYSKLSEDEKDGDESTITTTTLPRLYLGAETTIRPWITGRIGANRGYQSVTESVKPPEGDEVEISYQTSPYNVSFGLGLKFGNFLIDIDINDGMFFEGPNFMSGRFRDFSNRVSISYIFH